MSMTHTRSLSGGALLMSCACGASTNSAALIALAGVGASAAVIHPAIIAVAGLLVVTGLWRGARRSALLAASAFGVMGIAALLLPEHLMSSGTMGHTHLPWTGAQLIGAFLYLVAITLLGVAFWKAYPSPKPGASGAAIGGMALATGCTCCMVTGATAGAAMTLGATAPLQSTTILFWIAVAVVTLGIYRLGGIRAAVVVPAGALLVRTGLDWINKAFGQPKMAGINPYFPLKWALMFAGYGVMMYAFVLAYRNATTRDREPALLPLVGTPEFEGG